jgi:hypothetical protein
LRLTGPPPQLLKKVRISFSDSLDHN